jgi:uncharacterized protein YwqG
VSAGPAHAHSLHPAQLAGSDDASGFMWGDMGNLYLLIREQDLRARQFDKAWLGLQCG